MARALHSEADQLSMFGADASPAEVDALRGPDGRLPADAFRRLRAQNDKRPGRPLGAVNKRSAILAHKVIEQFGDPVLGGASLYAMPLDQLCEMLLVADGSVEREERLAELTGAVAEQVKELTRVVKLAARENRVEEFAAAVGQLGEAVEGLENVARKQGKPGALALQALNVQLMARRFVAEYVHAKRPTAVDVTHKSDGLLIMPRAGQAGEVEAVRDMVNAALRTGKLEADQVARLEFHDGKLTDPEGEIEEADFVPVDDGEGEE